MIGNLNIGWLFLNIKVISYLSFYFRRYTLDFLCMKFYVEFASDIIVEGGSWIQVWMKLHWPWVVGFGGV